ncbi:hypothetical protein DPMN_053876 [Dreissena polymorpha]|uniref:Uncharacterized protein n=1 Tax=Dreissena polymorpha TaxID=45954 RepID=A0A9D4HR49_DREPO|nr:hypothetical protein DPMN_053876 [Dreissena polymorpha]
MKKQGLELGEHAESRSFCTICFLADWLKVATTHFMGDDIYQNSWRHGSTLVSCTCPSLSLPLNQLEIFPPPNCSPAQLHIDPSN